MRAFQGRQDTFSGGQRIERLQCLVIPATGVLNPLDQLLGQDLEILRLVLNRAAQGGFCRLRGSAVTIADRQFDVKFFLVCCRSAHGSILLDVLFD